MIKENYSLEDIFFICEGPVHGLARGLRKEGYNIAGHLGIAQSKPTWNMIGILKDREPLQKNFYGIKYNKKQKALHIGELWLNSEEREARENKKWVLEVYGEEYIVELMDVVKKLSKPYNVKVQVDLINDSAKERTYLSEVCYY